MSAPVPAAGLLALAVLLASARMLWRWRRQDAAQRARGWRIAVLLLAQAAGAVLLYLVLFPPPVARETGTLVVLTARAGEVPLPDTSGDRAVALPEAGDELRTGAERVPDLASALRRYPAAERLRVVGTGLVARDREAARGHAIDFRPAPPLPGLATLQAPAQVPAGRRFRVTGRATALGGGSAELLDPADRRIDRAVLDDDGRFRLHGTARSAGLATWRLRLRNAQGQVADDIAVPLEITAPRPLRVHVLAGAATPELKYLRRWAVDAGVALESRIDLGAGLQVGTGVAVDAEALEEVDLLVLDTRSWRNLGASRRAALTEAIERGLGLLLRLDRPLDAGDRERLLALGFAASTDGAPRDARLGGELAGTGEAAEALPTLTASATRISAGDGVPLLADASATPLAVWRAHGRGRIGVSTFDDSFRLVLAGRDDLHGELWSRLFTTLARAPEQPRAVLAIEPATPHQRTVICGIEGDARVEGPGGRSVSLHVDPASGPDRCAGFWAATPGWHRVRSGEASRPFYVPDAARAAGLDAQATTAATRTLAAASPAERNHPAPATASRPGPRWPWFLAWLLLATATWWFERARPGRWAASGA